MELRKEFLLVFTGTSALLTAAGFPLVSFTDIDWSLYSEISSSLFSLTLIIWVQRKTVNHGIRFDYGRISGAAFMPAVFLVTASTAFYLLNPGELPIEAVAALNAGLFPSFFAGPT